jgi:hypothetical protein
MSKLRKFKGEEKMKNTYIYFFSIFLVSGLLAGCASNFTRPDPDKIAIEKNTTSDITNMAGKPNLVLNNININNETITAYLYFYGKGANFYGLNMPQRTQAYYFYKGVLVGQEFNSSFDEENTDFDFKKVSEIKKGQTKNEVLALLGKPAGVGVYPLINDKSGSALVYEYTHARYIPIANSIDNNLLVVSLDANNIVEDITFKQDSGPSAKPFVIGFSAFFGRPLF